MKEVTALIPVKANSERVVSKNLRPFGDTSLFELKVKQIKEVRGFADVIVSSESEDVLRLAQSHGLGIHLRDPRLSTSDVPMSEVYSSIARDITGEHIAWVNVTNPLAGPEVYRRALEEFSRMPSECDCLLSVFELREYIFAKGAPLNFPPSPWPKSQDLSGVYAMSFIINILRRVDMVKWGSTVGSNPYFFINDRVESSDVDYQIDFDFCEFVYNQRRNPKLKK